MKNSSPILVFVIICGFIDSANAQPASRSFTTEIPQQSVYLELGGNALVYSFNYDIVFPNNWGVRLGGGYFPTDLQRDNTFNQSENSSAFLGVIMAQRYAGRKASKLEIGAGLLFGTIYEPDSWDFLQPPGATFNIGYRYQPAKPSRFIFKAAFTPVITRSGFHPGIGISFGITLTPEGDAHIQ